MFHLIMFIKFVFGKSNCQFMSAAFRYSYAIACHAPMYGGLGKGERETSDGKYAPPQRDWPVFLNR